jgi:hypothetical protein
MATMQELDKLGFEVTGGQIDRGNVNYGFLSPTGPVLTEAGEDLVKSLKRRGKPTISEVVSDVMDKLEVEEAIGK